MTNLVFIDTETTGLDPAIHYAYEVAWRVNSGPIRRLVLPHGLASGDQAALEVGRYEERGIPNQEFASPDDLAWLDRDLTMATLVGSNPAFDAAFLKKTLGHTPWHYRLINVAEGGMWVFGWGRPQGLAAVRDELVSRGYEIPEPDHTAVGDVRTTIAVYYALRDEREALR